MSRRYKARAAVAANEQRRCRIDGCDSRRQGLSTYCRKHGLRLRRNGHPLATRVKLSDYKGELETARQFVRQHIDHAAMRAAIAWADRWIARAGAGDSVPASDHIRRLHLKGVAGRKLIEHCLAVWLLSHWRPARLPDDVRLTYALGTVVIYLAPRVCRHTPKGKRYYGNIGATPRRRAGEYIRHTLGIVFAHAVEALEAEQSVARDEWKALRQSFEPNAFELPPPPKAPPKAPEDTTEALPFPTQPTNTTKQTER